VLTALRTGWRAVLSGVSADLPSSAISSRGCDAYLLRARAAGDAALAVEAASRSGGRRVVCTNL
jgi:hypothetical protein